jgi:hypothetical protein
MSQGAAPLFARSHSQRIEGTSPYSSSLPLLFSVIVESLHECQLNARIITGGCVRYYLFFFFRPSSGHHVPCSPPRSVPRIDEAGHPGSRGKNMVRQAKGPILPINTFLWPSPWLAVHATVHTASSPTSLPQVSRH